MAHKRKPSNNLVISFLGDISLIGKYREFSAKNINPFLKISSVLQKSTYVVGNLEALSEGIYGENLLKKTRLKTDLRTLNFLKNIHVNLVTLANNHVYDNLLDGFEKTLNFLNSNSINYIGAAINTADLNKIYIEKIKSFRLAFLNYVHPDTKPSIPKNCPIKINEYKTDEIVKDIIFAKKRADYIFLLIHWGHDNSYYPAPWQRREAKIFIEAGADFIIGHHSHTMQGFEKIGNGYAFYGLGN
ncbi:MAG: CapA family protein, partial [Candidatus Thorarchaeota archaeon]